MNVKPTPGPWAVEEENIRAECNGNLSLIAFTCSPGPVKDFSEDRANAALIVAAVNACFSVSPDNPQAVAEALPELVDLAKAVLSLGKVLPDDTSEKPSVIFGHPNGIDWAELFLTAKDALAKIEGKA